MVQRTMKYSELELKYARPIANAILEDASFRNWILKGTDFEVVAAEAIPVGEAQAKLRSRNLKNPYWFNYWCVRDSKCMCRAKEGGIETDILIILKLADNDCLALHVEIKRPGDKLGCGQAESYPRRGACWANPDTRPKNVYPHKYFMTLLVCGRDLQGNRDIGQFDRVIFHDEVMNLISPYPEV